MSTADDRRMRRVEREIAEPAALDDILREAQVLFLALHDEPAPYVIPVCFAHDQGTLYIHSAIAGTKIDLIAAHPVVGFSTCADFQVLPGAAACDFTARARSVVGTGRAGVVEDTALRARGLDAIMRHYATGPAADHPVYKPGTLGRTCLIAIRIDSLRGKRIG